MRVFDGYIPHFRNHVDNGKQRLKTQHGMGLHAGCFGVDRAMDIPCSTLFVAALAMASTSALVHEEGMGTDVWKGVT